jgi:hypothetical protein
MISEISGVDVTVNESTQEPITVDDTVIGFPA